MGARREARECALQLLYQWDLRRGPLEPLAQAYWEVHPAPDAVREFADGLVLQAVEHLDRIDRRIEAQAHNWRLERMETVDRNVLRLAIGELLFQPETPPSVVINEAIEIARRYSAGGSAQFINGLLDSIRKQIEQEHAGGGDVSAAERSPDGA